MQPPSRHHPHPFAGHILAGSRSRVVPFLQDGRKRGALPKSLLESISGDLATNNDARDALTRELTASIEMYSRSREMTQLVEIEHQLRELRVLHQTAADLLFAADAALTERLTAVSGVSSD